MNKRQIVKLAVEGREVPYVPWHCNFTVEAADKLRERYGRDDLEEVLDNHFVKLGHDIGFFEDLGNDRFRDMFGVVWDRSIDKDIGNVENCLLPEPTLKGYDLPDPLNKHFFEDVPNRIKRYGDCFRVFKIGFSLYERAWTLRGMQNLMMDFMDHPDFVRQLIRTIADYNIAQATEAMKYEVDAVYFGFDRDNLYLRLDTRISPQDPQFKTYLFQIEFEEPVHRTLQIQAPDVRSPNATAFEARCCDAARPLTGVEAQGLEIVEIKIPFAEIPASAGQPLSFRIAVLHGSKVIERRPIHDVLTLDVPGPDFDAEHWSAL